MNGHHMFFYQEKPFNKMIYIDNKRIPTHLWKEQKICNPLKHPYSKSRIMISQLKL